MRENERAPNVEPRDTARYLAALREHWILVLAVLGVAVVVSFVYASGMKDKYTAQADVLVSPVDAADQALTGLGLLRDPTGSVFTTGRLLSTPQVQDAVMRRLNLHETRQQVMRRVKIVPVQQSNIVSIVGQSSDPARAALVANAFASALIDQRTRVFQARLKTELARLSARRQALGAHPGGGDAQVAAQLDNTYAYLSSYIGQDDPTLEVWSKAVTPDLPAPKNKTGIFAAFFAALLLGTGIAMTLELVSGRLRREYELAGKVAVLGRVPRLRFGKAKRYLGGSGSLPAAAWEAYRILRARIATTGIDEAQPSSIVVTSAIKGEGKTMTALNLALALEAAGEDVVLVDANLRNSDIARALGVEPRGRGLFWLLNGIVSGRSDKVSPADVLVDAGDAHPRLKLLLPEPGSESALDLLDKKRTAAILEALSPYGIVVVDSPALTEYGEAIALAGAADVVLLCVRLGRTSRSALEETLQLAARDDLRVVGAVVTVRRGVSGRGIRVIGPPKRVPAREPDGAPATAPTQ